MAGVRDFAEAGYVVAGEFLFGFGDDVGSVAASILRFQEDSEVVGVDVLRAATIGQPTLKGNDGVCAGPGVAEAAGPGDNDTVFRLGPAFRALELDALGPM